MRIKNLLYFFFAVKRIKTKYIFIAEDDDYIFANSIKKSERFLNRNNKFSCVKGINCLGELIINDKKILNLFLRNETSNQIDKSLVSSMPDKRLIKFYTNKHSSLFNGLHRRSSLLKTFKILGTRNFYNLFITELIFCLSVVYNGKIKRKNHIDYIKMDNTIQSSSSNFEKSKSFSKISTSSKFKEENNLILKYIKFSNLKNKEKFIFLHNKFLKRDKYLRIRDEIIKNSSLRTIKKYIKIILIKFKIYYLLKNIYLALFKSYYVSKNIRVLDKTIVRYIKKNQKDFEKIVDFNRNCRKL